MGAERAKAGPDELIAAQAARQHGVISLEQLEAAGIRRRGRQIRLARGQLHRLHRGVFAVGHPGLSNEGRCMAAVLAYGPRSALSHQSAGALWGLLRQPEVVHLTLPGKSGHRHRHGVCVHHSISLSSEQTTIRWNLPVTNPSRTLEDLRRILPRKQFAAALRQAEYLGLPIDTALQPDHTRSELEALFLALLRRHRLLRPGVNVRVGPYVVDFCWPAVRLIVELDGFRAHGTRDAFERDRARDIDLRLRGYEVLRLTWRQVSAQPAEVVRALRSLL